MKIRSIGAVVLAFACGAAAASQEGALATMHIMSDTGAGDTVGSVAVSETPYGLVFTPALAGLPPGLHGFHVHETGSCGNTQKDGKTIPAGAAGGHLDPAGSKRHGMPWGDGHLGDLPALTVDEKGGASNPVLAPRLKLADVKCRALMIHAGGDNHSDHPAVLGGGGARIACGIIK